MYKKVFKEVYALKDIEAFYKEMSQTKQKDTTLEQEYSFFLNNNQKLPSLINASGRIVFSGATENLYGFIKGISYFCSSANLMGVGKKFVGTCDEKEKTINSYWGDFWADDGALFWNRNTPQYMWVYGNLRLESFPNLGRGTFIIK